MPQRFEDVSPERLTAVLRASGVLAAGRVAARRIEPLGEGVGFAGSVARLHLDYEPTGAGGPASLIVKLPATLARNRALVELGQGHEREVRFYRELAGDCGIATPAARAAEYDPDPREATRDVERMRSERLPLWLLRWLVPLALWRARRSRRRYWLLLEDLAGARAIDQIEGVDAEAARPFARALGALHARHWEAPALDALGWLPRPDWSPRTGRAVYPGGRRRFVREFGPTLPAQVTLATDWVAANLERIAARFSEPPCTLLHGDFRLDNLLLVDGRVVAVDWQSVSVGRGVLDWAYFATGNLASSVDEAGEWSLLGDYHASLVECGVTGWSFEACRRDYTLAKLLVAFGNVAAARLLSLEGDRGGALLETIRTRLVERRLPPPPWAWLL